MIWAQQSPSREDRLIGATLATPNGYASASSVAIIPHGNAVGSSAIVIIAVIGSALRLYDGLISSVLWCKDKADLLGWSQKDERGRCMTVQRSFKWHHFQSDIILLCVRWYLRVRHVTHSTIPFETE
jgi:hypothetical protein